MLRVIRIMSDTKFSIGAQGRWILLAILVCPVSAFATTIVVVRTANLILIEADSWATWRGTLGAGGAP